MGHFIRTTDQLDTKKEDKVGQENHSLNPRLTDQLLLVGHAHIVLRALATFTNEILDLAIVLSQKGVEGGLSQIEPCASNLSEMRT